MEHGAWSSNSIEVDICAESNIWQNYKINKLLIFSIISPMQHAQKIIKSKN
jgi:hypothetical protein